MTVELSTIERKVPTSTYTLEISGETFNTIHDNLKAARSVALAIKAIVPTHLADRLDSVLAAALAAVGEIEVVSEEQVDPYTCPETGELRTHCSCADCTAEMAMVAGDRAYDERREMGA